LETHIFSVVVVVVFFIVVFIVVVFFIVFFIINIAIDKTTRTIDYNAPQCWWKVCFVCCAGAIGVECDVEKKSSGTYQ